jgi:Cu+-exporting ATPase
VGIDEVYHSLLPQDKAQLIKKYHPVIMVGDGINDSLALLKSDVAIAMGEGADTALNSSDVVLLESSLSSLLKAVLLSKRVYKTIKQNIGFSLIYNLFTIPLAVLGFIIPLFAALLMSLSSIIVTLNALRIKLDRRDYE